MATLLLDRADLEIKSESDCLALFEKGVRRGTVPLKLIERLVIQGSQTRLDSGVLIKLAEAGAATLLLSPRASRRVAIVLGPMHNDASVRLAQSRRVLDESFCLAWAKDVVRAKILRQRRLLATGLKERPDTRKPLFDALASLERIAAQVPSASATDSLRGLEGSAARAHFQGLAALLPPALGFSGRNRRPPRDPANACLSLSYTLLHFEAVRAAHMAGLDPLLGFYHRPAFGRESLACDLIEPLRPFADEWVWRQFQSQSLRPDHFTQDKGACLLGKAGRERFYAAWESQAAIPRRWLRLRSSHLAQSLRQEGAAWMEDDDEEIL